MRIVKINYRLKYIIVIVLIIICFCKCFLFFKKQYIQSNIKELTFYPYQFLIENGDISKYFSNRESLITKENNIILIGRNEKELKNGYYDIKFNINKEAMYIQINNLQKEDINFRSISTKYLEELKVFLSDILNVGNIDSLINTIKEEYTSLRNNINLCEEKINFRKLNVDKYSINFNIQSNMLKIDIKI